MAKKVKFMDLTRFNTLDISDVKRQLFTCCGSAKWVDEMLSHFPFASEKALTKQAEICWYDTCREKDWLEAFTQHPKIGDVKSLQEKFAATQHLAGAEQSGVNEAVPAVIEALATANQAYEAQFGFIFIVCASGKSAPEMLRLLEDRLKNNRSEEIQIALGEQHKITLIRLQKLLPDADWSSLKVSQITTHVLDTALGLPAKNMTIKMLQQTSGIWTTFCQGVTNADGRIGDLLPPGSILKPGVFKMVFETAAYFQVNDIKGFYPAVEVQFEVTDDKHYHIPLLLNPFGYTTYRGS